MVVIVRQVQRVVGTDIDSVRPAKCPLAPRRKEPAVAIENDDRVLASIENIHPVSRIAGHPDRLHETPPRRQPLPTLGHFVPEVPAPDGYSPLVRTDRHQSLPSFAVDACGGPTRSSP